MVKGRDDDCRVTQGSRLADLVGGIARGRDRGAFTELFDYFAPRLLTYLKRLGNSSETAEELCQEVLLAVWNSAATFDRRRSAVSTWLYTIARNKHIDRLRRGAGPAEGDLDDPTVAPEMPVQPDDAAAVSARRDHLREVLLALPEQQADLIRLAFYNGKSHREIAAATGLPLGTVKSRLRLALERLRKALTRDLD